LARYEELAQRQNTFRRANERIEAVAAMLGYGGARPFICECSRDDCTLRIEVSRDGYEAVRSNPSRFVTRLGHEYVELERVVELDGGFQVVEKYGTAGAIALAGDPRS
jgi:hypothetical protein